VPQNIVSTNLHHHIVLSHPIHLSIHPSIVSYIHPIMAENTASTSSTCTTSTGTNSDTASLFLSLVGSKHKTKLGSTFNETAAAGPNTFARAQLERLGWRAGAGLGKNLHGISEHVRVVKKAEEYGGIGHTSTSTGSNNGSATTTTTTPSSTTITDQWWKSSVGDTLARLKQKKEEKKQKKDKKKKNKKSSSSRSSSTDEEEDGDGKKKNKKKKRKRDGEDNSNNNNSVQPLVKIMTDEELFIATGGARFGMRAQSIQRGKWKRTEYDLSKDDIDRAMQQTEWDGLSAPKVILQNKDNNNTATMNQNNSNSGTSSSKKTKEGTQQPTPSTIDDTNTMKKQQPKQQQKQKEPATKKLKPSNSVEMDLPEEESRINRKVKKASKEKEEKKIKKKNKKIKKDK
jgi:Pin2-interacting protein X1